MSLIKRILRQFYQKFFEAPLWHFLTSVKAFFFAETNGHLQNIERFQRENTERIVRQEVDRIQRENADRVVRQEIDLIQRENLERIQWETSRHSSSLDLSGGLGTPLFTTQQHWAVIEDRLRLAEASNAAQWDGLEQLILAILSQPNVQTQVVDDLFTSDAKTNTPGILSLTRVHAASNIR